MKREKQTRKLGGTVKPVIVKNVRIGEGNPKIVVPIVAPTAEDILAEATASQTLDCDLVEWRLDIMKMSLIFPMYVIFHNK